MEEEFKHDIEEEKRGPDAPVIIPPDIVPPRAGAGDSSGRVLRTAPKQSEHPSMVRTVAPTRGTALYTYFDEEGSEAEEEQEMQKLNPKSPDELKVEEEESKFLNGDQSDENTQHEHHHH